jgi:shikimate kinase
MSANIISTFKTTGPVFLIGFMGSGKTHWGSRLAVHLNKKFIDLDQFIENREQLSVQQIFEKKGEDYFREKEAISLRALLDENNLLISCGGGAPCFHDNMDFMNQAGLTVFLEASPKFLLQNIVKEPQARPLLNNMNESEMLFFIEKKLAERNEFYRQAKVILNAEELNETSIKNL